MKIQVDDKDFECILEYEQIKKRIRLIGIQINVDFEGKVPVFVSVLNGSFIFMADLVKEVNLPAEITFVKLSSYEGNASTGLVKRVLGLDMDLKNRDVIIVEDIVDTGITMGFLLAEIEKHRPASVSICTLLLKPDSLKNEIKELTYTAFEIPNDFVVGYGLDYNGLGRNLKDIYRAVHTPAET